MWYKQLILTDIRDYIPRFVDVEFGEGLLILILLDFAIDYLGEMLDCADEELGILDYIVVFVFVEIEHSLENFVRMFVLLNQQYIHHLHKTNCIMFHPLILQHHHNINQIKTNILQSIRITLLIHIHIHILIPIHIPIQYPTNNLRNNR